MVHQRMSCTWCVATEIDFRWTYVITLSGVTIGCSKISTNLQSEDMDKIKLEVVSKSELPEELVMR